MITGIDKEEAEVKDDVKVGFAFVNRKQHHMIHMHVYKRSLP